MAKSLGLRSRHLIAPGKKIKLERLSTDKTGSLKKAQATRLLQQHRAQIDALQERLYASGKQSILVVLQGMDTSGKDGTVSHIFDGVNPQGCSVQSFKVPTPLEAKHDFLWRVHAAVPAKGMIGIFNRSHYEDVLWPRVHGVIDESQVKKHFAAINDFERMLAESGTVILKFFLNISRKEQAARLQERLDDASKHWKLNPADFAERKLWPEYQAAYEEILNHTSTPYAPWIAVPADHKWYRNAVVSGVLLEAMLKMKLEYPKADVDVSKLKL